MAAATVGSPCPIKEAMAPPAASRYCLPASSVIQEPAPETAMGVGLRLLVKTDDLSLMERGTLRPRYRLGGDEEPRQ
jgi:hypothetical protein